MNTTKLTSNEIEAANRAEATALLIRSGYRVYRPEADCYGEDLIIRIPSGELRAVQLKGRPTVDWVKYGNSFLWMLFPGPKSNTATGRTWFLVPHDRFYEWVKDRHSHTPKWNKAWSYPTVSKTLSAFLAEFAIAAPALAELERVEAESAA
jgi:hypothetical protein